MRRKTPSSALTAATLAVRRRTSGFSDGAVFLSAVADKPAGARHVGWNAWCLPLTPVRSSHETWTRVSRMLPCYVSKETTGRPLVDHIRSYSCNRLTKRTATSTTCKLSMRRGHGWCSTQRHRDIHVYARVCVSQPHFHSILPALFCSTPARPKW